MVLRRSFLGSTALGVLALAMGPAFAADSPGVTASEIKIGNIMPYSGPASSYAVIGKGEAAFFQMLNDKGGINGRKINFVSYDDGYSPPKAVEQVRKLVEQDQVAFIFNSLGTPSNTAIQKYLNSKKIPQLFVATGADKWGEYKQFPWTMGWQPSYRTEAQIYAKYILKEMPNAKVAILYQNDDFGKDYLNGIKDGLGDKYGKLVIKEASYEVTDPTIDSQVVSLKESGADTLISAVTPKFAAQTIRKVHDIGWQPHHFLTNVSISVGAVLEPAGLDKAVGIITSGYMKDPTDPAWKDDPGMKEWRAFMEKYMPGTDQTDGGYVYAYGVSSTLLQVLKQCGSDVSRENIMKQAANLKNVEIPVLLPGITVNTSATNFHPIRQLQLMKFDGKTWVRFGDVMSDAGS